ncbi:hypothetical protein TrVE_jg11863 [Triparma verrucosa]|uniref:Uncharacterized protein n=1 Tax=Triparma verrucosa TaxID=1606542 RepID=A0A9W7CC73_9STRA|nr:hypothetical protein TrVE_jg11863 [Triparma verrucosa]
MLRRKNVIKTVQSGPNKRTKTNPKHNGGNVTFSSYYPETTVYNESIGLTPSSTGLTPSNSRSYDLPGGYYESQGDYGCPRHSPMKKDKRLEKST